MLSISPETASGSSPNLNNKPNMLLSRYSPVSQQELREMPLNFDAAFVTRRTLPGFWGLTVQQLPCWDVGELWVSHNFNQYQLIMTCRRVGS